MRGKTIVGILAVSFLLVGSVYAQEQQKSADEIVQKMTTDLSLTPEQASAIKPIIEDNMAKRQELFNSTTDRSAIKGQMDQLRQDENQKLSQILTPDQVTKMNTMKEQRHQGIHQGKHHRDSASGE